MKASSENSRKIIGLMTKTLLCACIFNFAIFFLCTSIKYASFELSKFILNPEAEGNKTKEMNY